MSRVWPVIRREFGESVRTKMFVIGTVFGPLLMAGLMLLPALLARGGEVERDIVVMDLSGRGLGQAFAEQVEAMAVPDRARFAVTVVAPAAADSAALRADLLDRLDSGDIDGFLWLHAGVLEGAGARYEGKGASSFSEMQVLRSALQAVVQRTRLEAAGIDAGQVAAAMSPVPFSARAEGTGGARGTTGALLGLAWIMAFVMYMVVLLWGAAVQRGVLEEKRDRIVEVVVSSIPARDLMVGKIVGIGSAGLLQVGVWIAFAVLALTAGGGVVEAFGGTMPELPQVPISVGLIFLGAFAGGCFLYMCIFALVGAIATSDQEAQQLMFPAMLPIIAALMMVIAIIDRPDSTAAFVGTLVPFTSPLVLPVRAALTGVSAGELVAAGALLFGTAALMLWIAAKIYRIGILATGKRPTVAELWRWVRTA